jgi:hypothetical protein
LLFGISYNRSYLLNSFDIALITSGITCSNPPFEITLNQNKPNLRNRL